MATQSVRKFIFNSTDIVEIRNFLEERPEVDLTEYIDPQGNNILHQMAYRNDIDTLDVYVRHASKFFQRRIHNSKKLYSRDAKQELQIWVNEKNAEGFTPFLYAAYNGNAESFLHLEQYGSNILAETNTGLNALHLAAQNNKVATFLYFRDRIDLNSRDKNKGTPLHWASYMNCEEVVAYIVAQKNAKVDLRDYEGQTPLMLATIYGNTRIVRKLLIRGANRRIPNRKKKIPIDIARENQFRNIARMLDDQYTFTDMLKFYCNVKIDYKPKNRNMQIPIVFVLTAFVAIGILNALLKFTQLYSIIIEGVVFGLLIVIYFSLLWPPKTYPRIKPQEVYREAHNKFCFQCMRPTPKRGYHCDICHVCIQQYDHHCTWINNCVGKKNIARFITFLFLLIFSLGVVGIVSVMAIICLFIGNQDHFTGWFTFRSQKITAEYMRYLQIVLFTINVVISLFVFPVILLLGLQLKNLFLNRTTFQRYTAESSDSGSVKDQMKSKKKKKNGPSLKNCKIMCSKARDSFLTNGSLDEQLVSSSEQ